jgi:CheY-like chemotaxis protein
MGNFHPRAVLLDLVLPNMPGEEFLRQIRAAPGGDPPVIVVVTVKDLGEQERRTLMQLGVQEVLRKGPGVAAVAAAAVERALAGRDAADSAAKVVSS